MFRRKPSEPVRRPSEPPEHIPIGLNRSDRKEYAPAFESGAISYQPNEDIRAESALARRADPQAGFTLIEALVALAVAAVCLAAIGTLMAANNRTVRQVDQRLALVSTLRKVEAALPDRAGLANADLSGEMAGAAWRVRAAPYPDPLPPAPGKEPPAWSPQTVSIRVRDASGSFVELETLRLVPRTKQ